jgi:hypothetical protein
LAATVSSSFFLQNIWLIMLTNPAARGTASNYLSRRLPTLNPDDGKQLFVLIDAKILNY